MFKGPAVFYIDFVLYPLGGLWLMYLYGNSLSFYVWIIFGFLLFTFFEYWMHRSILHGPFFYKQHEEHHKHPEAYVVFPWYYVPSIYVVFFVLFPLPVFIGLMWGYAWFILWHHLLHHVDLNFYPKFVRTYAKWHLAHHHNADCNHGITVPIWDWLFRTSRKV